MKIEVIQPVPISETERKRRQEEYDTLLHGIIDKNTTIHVVGLDRGPSSIAGSTDQILSDIYVLTKGARAEEEGFRAVVVDCVFDPSVDALREMLDIPVVGPFQNAMALATTLGERISILCLNEVHARVLTRKAHELGVHPWRLASARTLGVTVDDTLERKKKMVLTEGRKAVFEDGANTLVLGCTTIVGIDKEVSRELDVPVIAPSVLAIRTAETLAKLGISHSKKAYPVPGDASKRLLQSL